MALPREITQGTQVQGIEEEIPYTVTTTPWGSTPTSLSVVVKSVTAGLADVTSTVMPSGSPSAVGDIVTLPTLKSLTENVLYRIELKFTSGGSIFEVFAFVKGEL